MKRPPSLLAAWPREKVISQWHKVAADPRNARYPQVQRMAAEALANLHAESEREPGADDA